MTPVPGILHDPECSQRTLARDSLRDPRPKDRDFKDFVSLLPYQRLAQAQGKAQAPTQANSHLFLSFYPRRIVRMNLEREAGRGSATQLGAVCYYGVSQYDDTPRRLRRPTAHGILRPYQQAAEDVHKVGGLNLNCLFKLSPPSVADRPRTKGLVAETNYLTFLVRLFVVYAARSCASLACKDGGARTDPRIYHLRVGGLSYLSWGSATAAATLTNGKKSRDRGAT